MRKVSVLLLASCLSLVSVAPALADPVENAPFRAGSTAAAVLTQIAAMGDDAYSTTDLTAAMWTSGNAAQHYGPFSSTSPDSSTCGNDWAQDTFDRHFTVRSNGAGSYTIVEQFKNGSFVTMAGASPGGCDTDPGGTIRSGVTGELHGYEDISVTGTQTSQDSSCIAGAPAAPCTTTGFIQSHFTGAMFTVGTFFFHYSAGDQTLAHGEWKNASCDRGGNQGDIASTSLVGLQRSALCP